MPTLEKQLAVLKTAGITLHSGITIDDLLQIEDRSLFEDEPYRFLFEIIGDGERFSHNILHLDAACVDSDGVYAELAVCMRDLAGGDLPLEAIEEMIDWEANSGWLAFHLKGEAFKWEFQIHQDWIDETVFSRFALLMERQNCGKRFIYGDLQGQNFLVGYASPEQLDWLNKHTGIDFSWLR